MGKAEQFLQSALDVEALADDEDDVVDAVVTLLVHAGIAASDVLCCASLGKHAFGDSHHDAVSLVRQIEPHGDRHATDLWRLLGMKSRSGYGAGPTSRADMLAAKRAAGRLVGAARAS